MVNGCVESEAGYGSNKSYYQAKKVWDVYKMTDKWGWTNRYCRKVWRE